MFADPRILLPAILILLLMPGEGRGNPAQNQGIEGDSVFYFKGRVLDSLTREPVAFTHVINKAGNRAVICDTLGYFYMRVRKLDTLFFSALGYAPIELVMQDSLTTLEVIPDIMLRTVSYDIQAVMINPLGTYESFKYKVAQLKLPRSPYEINPTVLADIEEGTDTLDMVPMPVMSPVTALYNLLSKEGREKRKYLELIRQEQFEKEIAYKYSPLIVSGITGYSGFELYSFMEFCSFKKKFLQEANRYEIHDAVLQKQKEWEALREEGSQDSGELKR